MNELRVGIIGCGRMGRERARSANLAAASIAAVFDVDGDRARSLALAHPGCEVSPSAEAVLDCGVDAMFLCTPPARRSSIELAAIERGVPFLVEKPLGIDASLPRLTRDALKSAGLLAAAGYMNRYRSGVQRAKDVLAEHRLLGISCHWAARKYAVPWWLEQQSSGGPLNEQATHLLDLCRYIGGEVAEVRGVAAASGFGASLALRFETGAFATLLYSCESNEKQIGLRLITEDGCVSLSDWDLRVTEDAFASIPLTARDEDIFLIETQTFLRAVSEGLPDLVASPYDDALRTQELMDTVREVIPKGS